MANDATIDPSVDKDKASDPSVDANPTPSEGETPEGSVISPQPTDQEQANTVPVGEVGAESPKEETDTSGVQTSSDLQ